jgi:uncharacterized protein (TIGR00369 family)
LSLGRDWRIIRDAMDNAPTFRDNGTCFVCGGRNAAGLNLAFTLDPENGRSAAHVIFPAHLQGWEGIVHGGLLTAVLDEAMIKAGQAKGIACITAEITVRFKKPALTGQEYLIKGRIIEDQGKFITADSEIVNSSGTPVACARGKLFVVRVL